MFKRKRRRRGDGLLRFGFILMLLLILLATALLLIPLLERGDRRTDGAGADWMARLDDGLPLGRIQIPGTHDSATQYVQLAFFSRCQALSVREQLEAGFRYLDIRLGDAGQALQLMHGFTQCKTGFGKEGEPLFLDAVLAQCYGFLDEHPGETLLFAVKQEYGEASVAEFQALLDGYIRRDEGRWLLGSALPSLGEARGKLVLLRRYEDQANLGERAGVPLIWADQSGAEDTSLSIAANHNEGYPLWVQDRYEYDAAAKWSAFQTGLKQEPGVQELALHFLSTKGPLPYGHPYYYARALNARLLEKKFEAGRFYGWIVVDFGSAAIARQIYRLNFS